MPGRWQAPCRFLLVTQGFHSEHVAIDFISTNEARPLLTATFPGVVTFAGRDNRQELPQHPEWDRGNYVAIDHDDGRSSRWCHLETGSLTVKVGDRVRQGQVFGRMGNTGYVIGSNGGDGTHCHGAVVDPDDQPEDWLYLIG